MNKDKAREFFSAYYEGNLDGGLRQNLEARLRSDADLRADYAAFERTMDELSTLKFEEIEVPIFLNDRIATRLEQAEASRRPLLPMWAFWARNLAFGGLAAAAIFGAVISLNSRGETSQASIGSVSSTAPSGVQLRADGSTVVMTYQAVGDRTVAVQNGVDGPELQRISLKGQRLESPLSNPNARAAVFTVRVEGDSVATVVVVPGVRGSGPTAGTGTVLELAQAIADFYRTPVQLDASDLNRAVEWQFTASDARTAAVDALEPHGYAIDQRSTGILRFSDR